MTLEAVLYLAPLFVGGIISLLLLWTLFPRRDSPAIRMFLVFLAAVILWTFAYALELWADTFQAMLLWRKLRYVGVAFAPVLWFCFAMRYSGREKCTRPAAILLLSVIPAIALVFLWTSGRQGLFFTEMTAVPGGPFQVISDTPGPFFWLQATYGYLLVAAAIAFILRSATSAAGIYTRQALTVAAGILAPVLGNVSVLLGVTPAGFPYDVTPALFPIAVAAVWWSVTRFRFLDLVPIAGKALFDSLDDVIFVVDNQDRVVDGNPAAIAFLRSAAAGTPSNESNTSSKT